MHPKVTSVLKYSGFVLLCLVLGCVTVCLWLALRYNQFQDFPRDTRYSCRKIVGIPNGEDIAVDWPRQQAFISSSDGTHLIDLRTMKQTNVTPAHLRSSSAQHGLSLYNGADGGRSLFVVNHALGESVRIFSVAPDGGLKLVEEIRGSGLRSPNDLVATGPRQFYVTNISALGASRFATWLNMLKVVTGWDATGDVSYFDGRHFRTVATGLSYPNGINRSPDGSRFYVAETTGKRVSIFTLDPASRQLVRQGEIQVPGGPDNIDVTPSDELFVAAIPRLLHVLAHRFQYTRSPPPAQIVRVAHGGEKWKVDRIWTDDGGQIAAASVGAPYAKSGGGFHFIVGSFSDEPPLACRPGNDKSL